MGTMAIITGTAMEAMELPALIPEKPRLSSEIPKPSIREPQSPMKMDAGLKLYTRNAAEAPASMVAH